MMVLAVIRVLNCDFSGWNNMDLQILHMYQDLREAYGSVLTPLFKTISDLGGNSLGLFVFSVIYWCISKQLGQRIMMVSFGGGVINQTLKNTFCVYRPFIRDTTIIPAESISGYSFPSGHSQIGVGIYGNIFLACRKKKKILAAIAAALTILIPISRNYLCVHTPQDVIIGLLEGILCIYIFNTVMEKAKEHKNGDMVLFAAGLILTVIHLMYVSLKQYPLNYTAAGDLLVDPYEMTKDCYGMAGLFLGGMTGWLLEGRFIKFNLETPIWVKIFRAVLGCAGFIIVAKSISFMSKINLWFGTLAGSFCIILFVVFIWPLIFSSVERLFKKWTIGNIHTK